LASGKVKSNEGPIPAGEVIAGDEALERLFSSSTQVIEEKIDGSNCAIMLNGNDFIIRNRDHVLKKGYIKKETPAKLQFRPLWNWAHDHRENFEKLNETFGYPLGVYGEWLWALHGIVYNALPSYFIAFDLYDPERYNWIASDLSRPILKKCGFTCPPLIHKGPIDSISRLDEWSQGISAFSSEKREGIYIKDSEGTEFVTCRYKMVREGYVQGAGWSHEKITRQQLRKS
jgi:hypothetical protein